MIDLTHGPQSVRIIPEIGGSLGYWRHEGREILHPVSDPNLRDQKNVAVGGYPLIPYSNRIANGRFSWESRDYHLTANMAGQPHSIHGNAWQHEWTTVEAASDRAMLEYVHTPRTEADHAEWPFPYRAVLSFFLDETALQIRLAVTNCADVRQPVGLGYHPFFSREPGMQVRFKTRGVWTESAAHLPADACRAAGEWDFSGGRMVDDRAIDNCFYGWAHEASLIYPKAGYALHISATDHFGHLVMYTAPDKPFVALEPVTNMTNAIRHPEVSGNGLVILNPGQSLTGTITLAIQQVAETVR